MLTASSTPGWLAFTVFCCEQPTHINIDGKARSNHRRTNGDDMLISPRLFASWKVVASKTMD
jgi:hypothetical protein